MPYLLDSGLYSIVTTSGAIGVGWKLNFYRTGTSTRNATYPTQADALALTNANANPVVIPADGRIPVCWLTDTYAYKGILTDENDVVKKTVDPLQSVTATGAAYTLEQFGALGDGTTDDVAAFNLWRAAVAAIQAASSTAWVALNLMPGKTYASRDNGWLLGLKQVIVNGNGAHFKNICTAGQSPWDVDHLPIAIGMWAYLDNITTMMAGKGLSTNHTAHYRINTVGRGSATVTTTTAADAGNFTAGDYALICSDIAYVGGQPPSMHFFQYAKCLTAVAGTGVFTLDGELTRNDYSATRDNTLLSGTFGSAARIFKVQSGWNTDLIVRDLNVDPSANFPGFGGYVVGGRNVSLQNCQIPGFTASMVDSFEATNCVFNNATAYEPVDKLARLAVFDKCAFKGASISGDGSGGIVVIRGGSIDGQLRAWANTTLDGTTFGGTLASGAGIKLGNATRFSATNCNGPSFIISTYEAVVLTVDGATITATATTIVVPRASITTGSTLASFYGALTVGCRIDVVSDTTGTAYPNGHFCRVTSITDVGANLVIGVNYSGGALIAPGTVFHSPRLLSYHGQGNFGSGAIISNTAPQSTTGIPNGGLDDVYGNARRFLIDPLTGETFDNAAYPASGIPKRVWVNVKRAYTGATYAAGLGLEFLGVQPTAAQYERISLLTVGVREATRSVATAALGADTWAALPATYTGRYRLVINSAAAGAGVALNEATQLLPMVELLLEFEDVAHSVPVAS